MASLCSFDLGCKRCPRLVRFRASIKAAYPDYHARPVPAFGDPWAGLLIVGLAPGLHGANATGRPFTGDYAGALLLRVLYDFGLCARPESNSADDDPALHRCRITNAVKCVPPRNRPLGVEVKNCKAFLEAELLHLPPDGMVLALGHSAHRAVVSALGLTLKHRPLGHGKVHSLQEHRILINCYHCSRYNVQTGRLTEGMFRGIFEFIMHYMQPRL